MFKIFRNIQHFFSRPEIQKESRELYEVAKLAAETHAINKPTAEATNSLATATATIVASTAGIDNVCMRIGVLLIVKTTNEDGRAKLITHTLSPQLASLFDKNPHLIDDPYRALETIKRLEFHSNSIEDLGIDTT